MIGVCCDGENKTAPGICPEPFDIGRSQDYLPEAARVETGTTSMRNPLPM